MGDWGSPSELVFFFEYAASHWREVLLGTLLLIVVLLVEDPDRAEKLKAHILTPTYRFFRLFRRQYLASRIGSSTTIFIKKNVTKYLPTLDKFKIRVKWVRSAKDPILKKDGTVLLHIPDSNDQTLNVMRATRAALPAIVCKSIRRNIDPHYGRAIDLTILKRLASNMGSSAYPVFQKHFLLPETAEDAEVQALLSELIEIDDYGIFVSIFLNELESLEADFFHTANPANITAAVRGLLEFLLKFPRRARGAEIPLTYNAPHFRLAVILVAKTDKAQREGTLPYVKRVHRNLTAGVHSIYLYAFEVGTTFLRDVCRVLKKDDRLWVGDIRTIRTRDKERATKPEKAYLVLLRRNPLFCDDDFQKVIDANEIIEGSRVQGRVASTSPSACLVEVCGVLGTLPKNLCSWSTIQSCEEVYEEGDTGAFIVHRIDRNQGILTLSSRLPENDPWANGKPPITGDVVQVKAKTVAASDYVCQTGDQIEVSIPQTEVSWFPWECLPSEVIGKDLTCKIVSVDESSHTIMGSVRSLHDDPWPAIHRELKPGIKMVVSVQAISQDVVSVATDTGLRGFILGKAIDEKGLAFAELQKSISVGAKLPVEVDKVFISRQKIRFTLPS